MTPAPGHSERGSRAFSLIEMVSVMAVTLVLLAGGAGLLHGTGVQSLKAGSDLLLGLIDHARMTAIKSRAYVVLAVAEPGDLPGDDGRCRLALFTVASWPDAGAEPLRASQLGRWRPLGTGIVLLGGEADGVVNPVDGAKLTLSDGGGRSIAAHAIAFNPRGGLHYPAGVTPVTLRLGEGGYQNGGILAFRHGAAGVVTESRVKVSRVTSHTYRTDG